MTEPSNTAPAGTQPNRQPGRVPGAQRRRLGGVVGVAGAVVVALAVAVGVAVGLGYWMWRAEPDYWRAFQEFHQSTEADDLAQMAEEAENRTAMELSNVGASPPRPGTGRDPVAMHTLELSYQWMNAWLAHRLEPWLAHQHMAMPEVIDRPMVTTHRGSLVLAFRTRLPEVDQVMSIVFDLEVLDNGQARFVWRRTLAGRLPLPSQWVKQQVVERVAEQVGTEPDSSTMTAFAEMLSGEPFDPLLNIDTTRRARLVDINVEDTGVELTVRIEPRAQSSAAAPFPQPTTP